MERQGERETESAPTVTPAEAAGLRGSPVQRPAPPTAQRSTYGVGTRLKEPPSKELREFFQRAYLSTFDETAFQAVARINLAHTVMLAEVGVVSREEAKQILTAVRQ